MAASPTVHPRVCGERARSAVRVSASTGSSPRVRGTADRSGLHGRDDRFIPACAGNGSGTQAELGCAPVHPRVCGERGSCRPTVHRRTVHPRVCGERPRLRGRPVISTGSSPRVRGTVGLAGPIRARSRFIPACAGNGSSSASLILQTAVHPRVCGERRLTVPLGSECAGSSPRVRGTEIDRLRHSDELRFIPACAGNGCARASASSPTPVHPRVCGERSKSSRSTDAAAGSSPRVRGTVHHQLLVVRIARFIPACAGNGDPWRFAFPGMPVHPRVCGERRCSVRFRCFVRGSSPRVRGTDARSSARLGGGRFIPACAGNGRSSRLARRPPSVHPRVCGERSLRKIVQTNASGSSPRVRGTEHPGLPDIII